VTNEVGIGGANRSWFGPAAFYTMVVAGLFRFYRFDFGPDAVSYISIARHYAAGRWAEALNVAWSPMFSWLLAPLIRLGMAPLDGGRLLCFLSGLLALQATSVHASRFGLTGRLRQTALYLSAWVIAGFALLRNGPDLLEAALLLYYFLLLFSERYPENRSAGLRCGVLGAAAFLTKAYGFYFFLLHFTLFSALHWVRSVESARGGIVRQYAAGMAALLVLCAPWIAAVSLRSGKPTLGSSGSWNYRLIGPETPGYPQYLDLIPPPHEHSVSMWEAQSPDLLPDWKPWTARTFRHQLRVLAGNLKVLRGLLADASLLGYAILVGAFVCLIAAGKSTAAWSFPLLTMVTYAGGYLLVIIQDRYLWALFLLMLLMGTVLAGNWSRGLPPRAGIVLMAAFALSFTFPTLQMMISHRNAGRQIYQLAEAARGYGMQGRLASCGEWNDSDALAFHLGLQYYGSNVASQAELEFDRGMNPGAHDVPADAMSRGVADSELAEQKIGYYLVWNTCRTLPASVRDRPEITNGSLPGLKIYRLPTP
jgi:hypothetical protein